MIEKLKEILIKNQFTFIDYKKEQDARDNKRHFLIMNETHDFMDEYNFLTALNDQTMQVYWSYERMIEDIKKLVDSLEK